MMECPTAPTQHNSEVWSLVLCWSPENGSLCTLTVKILSPNTVGAVSTVAWERKGDCGPNVQEELVSSVGVVDRVKSEKTVHWECFSTFLEGLSPIIYAVGTKASTAMM